MSVQSEHLTDLIAAAAGVVGQADLRSVLFETVEAAMHMTGARYGALGIIGQHETLAEFLHVGLDREEAATIGPLPTGQGLLGTLIRSTDTIRIDRIADHPDSIGFPANHPPMSSFLGVPIRLTSRVFGNLYLTNKPTGFDADDESLVESLAVIAGAAVSTARLQDRLRKTAIVEDRERIARDLHDAIIQDLFAVGLSLQGMSLRVEDGDIRDMLSDAVERLDVSISELRRFIFGLRPPVWAGRNLANELADLAGNLGGPHDMVVDVQIPSDLGKIEPETVEAAIQMTRESLSNALRHAKASAITVTVDEVDGTLLVMVSDDGIGFDPGAQSSGMGLGNLRTRAESSGGTVDIRSQKDAGTSVIFRIPLH